MRIAFYAPLKAPTHAIPSGDRRVARLLMQALSLAGHEVELASEFRSYEGRGDPARQAAIREEAGGIADSLLRKWRENTPQLWFTYHVYYKAPDWLGPRIAKALGIPYVLAEATHAPKRAGGPWAIGHEATAAALGMTARVFCLSRDDEACLVPLVGRGRITFLPPFLDPAPYRANGKETRDAFARQLHLPESEPWIVVAAMMREGDKLESYRLLAKVLSRVVDLPWRLLVAGDGAARGRVEAAFDELKDRVKFLGALEEEALVRLYGAGDLMVWPGVNEAFGMALLEAQAAGLPVVSCALRGIPDVVADGRTGLLAASLDEAALAARVRELLMDEGKRSAMGAEAARRVAAERSVAHAAERLRLLP
ncbi:MAG TPA: glycosyltransferase family 4 protein [Burkholderiales bacterium]|nr:glycosyltransferase family 4 protein [Burkholderiales bacterium]